MQFDMPLDFSHLDTLNLVAQLKEFNWINKNKKSNLNDTFKNDSPMYFHI